jgi:hypothetical protein
MTIAKLSMSAIISMTKQVPGAMVTLFALALALVATSGCDDDPGLLAPSPTAPRYRVTFSVVSDDGLLGALQFDVEYLGSSGTFVGAGGSVSCVPRVSVHIASFNDRGDGRLSAALVDIDGFPTPAAIADCYFVTDDDIDVGSFAITTIDAAGVGDAPLTMLPVMEVTALHASDGTDADPLATTYDVTVAVVSDSGVLGALQFDVRHLGVSGGWVGAGGSVDCTPEVEAALTSFNDRGAGRLSAAFVDLEGFGTPTDVATCRFRTREPLDTESFDAMATDASGPSLVGSDTLPEMAVTHVAALD